MNKQQMFKIMLKIAKKYNLSVKCMVTDEIRYNSNGEYLIKYKSYRLFDENIAKDGTLIQSLMLMFDVNGTVANDYFQLVNGYQTKFSRYSDEDESIRTSDEELICKQIEKYRAGYQKAKQEFELKVKQDEIAFKKKQIENLFKPHDTPPKELNDSNDFFDRLAEGW